MNTPYVNFFDEQGLQTNPITKNAPYLSFSKNQRERREILQKNPFKGNKKGVSLSVAGASKYHRISQLIKLKDGSMKTINHYS